MIDKIKELLKTSRGKVGFGIIIFGILSILVTQAARNGTSFGQSLLVGGVFILIGAVLLLSAKKKAPAQESTDARADEDPPGTVYVYPGSKVYHLDWDCSYQYGNEAEKMSEAEALKKGYHKCKKCQSFTGYI